MHKVLECETNRGGQNRHDIKQKAWSMDPSVTSLIKTRAFIRRGALQYLYHEYFRVPGRNPDRAQPVCYEDRVPAFLSTAKAGENSWGPSSYFPFSERREKKSGWKLFELLLCHLSRLSPWWDERRKKTAKKVYVEDWHETYLNKTSFFVIVDSGMTCFC